MCRIVVGTKRRNSSNTEAMIRRTVSIPMMARALTKTICLLSFITVASVGTAQQTTVPANFVPPLVSISSDATVLRNCGATNAVVHLVARSDSNKTSNAQYKWTADGGRIDGTGATVTWILDGVAPGYYHANLEALTGSPNEECQAFASTGVLIECPPAPACPQVAVVCPERIDISKPLAFTALVTGTLPSSPLVYNWTVSGGTLVQEQGANSMTVNASGLEGQSITATVSLAGYEAACSATCTVQLPVTPSCKKFDEFPDISRNDEKARLDNLVIELQNDPFATAYIVVHPSSEGRKVGAAERSRNVLDYLVNSRGLDANRVVMQTGSALPASTVEIWTCPRGAHPH